MTFEIVRFVSKYQFISKIGFYFLSLLPDKLFLKIKFRLFMNKRLNLRNPQTFNEKIQWLKLYDRNPRYTQLVDKVAVREYVKQSIGEDYLIPIYGVYDSFDEINFDELPNEFVLKPNHTSGNVFICRDKTSINYTDLRKTVNLWMERDYFSIHREWPYKNILPKIVCEKYMVDESRIGLIDYKFFCFDGVPKAMFIATNRGIDTRFDFYDLEFNHLPFMQHYKNSEKILNKPVGFEEMIKLSKILSRDIPHVRVDFYDIQGKVYFGELTFSHFSGFEKFEPEEYDYLFGSWIKLPLN